MKKLLFLSLIFVITGCSNDELAQVDNVELCNCLKIENCECENLYQKIDLDQAKELLKNENTKLIDVRTTDEYETKHIDGAISIPLSEINNITFSKETNIIVYCQSGRRSKQAATELLNLGYVNVYDFGGINNWSN